VSKVHIFLNRHHFLGIYASLQFRLSSDYKPVPPFSFRYCDFSDSFTRPHLAQHTVYSPIQSPNNVYKKPWSHIFIGKISDHHTPRRIPSSTHQTAHIQYKQKESLHTAGTIIIPSTINHSSYVHQLLTP
jgi:hypothetical protein